MTEEEYFRKNYPDSCYGDRLLSPHWDFFQDGVEFGERESEKKIEELEEERNDYRDKYETVKNESEVKIAELKADNDARKFAMAMSEKVEKQLREENAELRKEWQEQVQKATDEGYARTLQTIQLAKAKNYLKYFIEILKKLGANKEPLVIEAEQFLKDSEVE